MSSVVIAGNTSGSITISAPDVSGSNTLTLPVATDTLVGKATTDTLTNKTLVNPTITGNLTTTGNTILGDASTDTLNVGNGGLVKDASGNVGIGTASPASYGKLVSLGADNATTFAAVGATNMLRVQGYNSTYVGTVLEAVNLAQSANTPLFINASQTQFGISGTERMRIDSAGNVGIGLTNPSAYGKFVVAGSHICSTPNFYASLFDANYGAAAFNAALMEVPNDMVNHWIPVVGGAAYTAGQGYVTQVVFGVKKIGTGSFAQGAYIGVTSNSDNGPGREFLFDNGGNFSAPGAKSFRIPHPLPEKAKTHELWHVALESPNLDLIYRGSVDLVGGKAEVNIDTVSRMTDGTFVALTKDAQSFTSNESDWILVRGSVNGNILYIEAQDNTATSNISWMVIAKRNDNGVINEETTDANGEFVTERSIT